MCQERKRRRETKKQRDGEKGKRMKKPKRVDVCSGDRKMVRQVCACVCVHACVWVWDLTFTARLSFLTERR